MSVVRDNSFLLYGDTGDGKTALVGELAEHIYKTQGGKITRLCTADRGGVKTVQPYIDLGIIQVVPLDGDPWIWLNKVVRGFVKRDGKWVHDIANIGLFAFESMTSVADSLMQNLAQKAAMGVNIGGGGNVNFSVNEEGVNLKIGGNNMAHYGVVQTRIIEEVWESQRLPGWLIWTASAKRDEDPNATGKLLGPAIAGKALTGEVPRWFVYTFRVAAVPATASAPEKHILYLGDHSDVSSGNAKGLGNTRAPLDAPKLPTSIEPASIVKALQMMEGGSAKAVDEIKKRLNLK